MQPGASTRQPSFVISDGFTVYQNVTFQFCLGDHPTAAHARA